MNKTRNALYRLAAEFKRRHPKATAKEAWSNLCAIAALGVHEVLISHNAAADVLSYRPDKGKIGVRELRRRSFEQRYYSIR